MLSFRTLYMMKTTLNLAGFGLRLMGMCLKSRTDEKPTQESSAAVRTSAIICCGCSLTHLLENIHNILAIIVIPQF